MLARKAFPKGSARHSPNGSFRKALERRALPPSLRDRISPRVMVTILANLLDVFEIERP
jgi:hypothetical protein